MKFKLLVCSESVLSSEEGKLIQHTRKSFYRFIAFITTILLALIFKLNILHTDLIGVAFMLVTNTIQIKEALSMIEYKTIILISTSFAIGKALTNTGTAAFVARILEPFIGGLHPLLLLIFVFLITNFFTTIITNTMVYGTGGYRFRDFIKFRYPLIIIVMRTGFISASTWDFLL